MDLVEGALQSAGDVLDLVIPGVGRVVPALLLAYKLCRGLHECGSVCELVQRRYQELLDAMLDLDAKNELPRSSVLPRFSDSLATFIAFLQRHQRKNALMRLGSNRAIMDQVQRTNEEIDALFKLLQLEHMGEMSDWRKETEKCWDRQQTEMQEVLDNQRVITQFLSDSGLVEALALIKYEYQHQRDKNTPTQLQMMNQTFYRAVHASKAIVPAIPPWFIPSDGIVYKNDTFEDGDFGRVRRGQWNQTEVVVKTLLASDAKTQTSFLKEAEIWIKLNHPHVLKLYGACHVSSPPFFVCEDAEQGNFKQYFSHGQNRHVFWRLFREVLNGMLYLAKEKIVHGNLKCNNLLVGADGKAKIADFGFSFIRSESRALSKKSQVDSVRWKAPECIRGDVESPDHRADVFSLGMCIIEAWTGDLSETDIVDMAIAFRAPEQPAGMSDRAWELVERMCHPNPSERITLSEAVDEMMSLSDEESHGDVRSCPVCDIPLESRVRFCASCGSRLSARGTQLYVPPPSRSLFMIEFDSKLAELSPLCDEVQEYQLLCHHVRTRIEAVNKQLAVQDRDGSEIDTEIMRRSLDVVDSFRLFLEDLRTKMNIVVLVLSQLEVLSSLEHFHRSIDALVERIDKAEADTWQQQWDANRMSLETKMQHRVSSASDLSEHVPRHEDQKNAVQKLRNEIKNESIQNSPTHVALMRSLLDGIQKLILCAPGLFKLTITLVRATKLVAADYWKGTSDPYVVFLLGNVKQRSTMLSQALNPVWKPNESFDFIIDTREVSLARHKLIVEVWDDDTFTPDDLIGTLSLPIQTLLELTTDPDAVVVLPLKVPLEFADQKRRSKIHIKIAMHRIKG